MWAVRRAPRCAAPSRPPRSPAEPDTDHVPEHVQRAADGHDLGGSRVSPYDRDLGDPCAAAFGEVEHLRVEAKAVSGQGGEGRLRDIGPKELEAALGIPDAGQQHRLHDQVEDLAHQHAVDGLWNLDLRTAYRPRRDGD